MINTNHKIEFSPEKCVGCQLCYKACFVDVIRWDAENKKGNLLFADEDGNLDTSINLEIAWMFACYYGNSATAATLNLDDLELPEQEQTPVESEKTPVDETQPETIPEEPPQEEEMVPPAVEVPVEEQESTDPSEETTEEPTEAPAEELVSDPTEPVEEATTPVEEVVEETTEPSEEPQAQN